MQQKIGGVSVKGDHEINQDYFICTNIGDVSIIAMSDGLGSKLNSHIGAKAICEIIEKKVYSNECNLDNLEQFLLEIHKEWINKLSDYTIKDCSATSMFCVLKGSKAYMGQLGDGFICLIDKNNKIVLNDNDSEHFVNETDCLTTEFVLKQWKFKTVDIEDECTVVISTDGIDIKDGTYEDIISFVEYFKTGYAKYTNENQMIDIKTWVSNWCGQDDKTIAYIMRT